MKYDGKLDIALGVSRRAKKWSNRKWNWSQLVQRLSEEKRTDRTYKEFIALPKVDQAEDKDVGGYVGGHLSEGKRSPKNVMHRQIATLDIDFAHIEFWEDFKILFGNAAVLHSTHKHHEKSPRFRLIMPLSREVSPDEYVAVCRRIAGDLGIDLFDNTTFEVNRLMYWPSVPKDSEYYFQFQDGPWIDVDVQLRRYVDWHDTSLWPTSEAQFDRVQNALKKQEDPENKKGIIGAFCRAHDIHSTISTYLSDFYTPSKDGRYTYAHGTTSSGLVIYQDKFAFSHHGTDPCGGKLCNAFDLVRLHKFSYLDEPGKTHKSLEAMRELALKDGEVKKVIASESLDQAKYDFGESAPEEEEDTDWMKELELDTKGNYKSSAVNLNLIFSNDPRLAGLFKDNMFDAKRYIFGNLPWRRTNPPEVMRNVDYSGVRNYVESIYGIIGNLKIDDCLALESNKQAFHPVREYLRELKWDQTNRMDNLLIDYFGAEDNLYTRQVMRKTLLGAVSRVFNPGVKFDLVLTLVGKQGTGKSTFASKLGREWFSDTFMTVHGKEALEQIQGAWIIEMAELSGLRKAEVEAVKHFISKQVDSFRPAYGRVSEVFPRQCIFIGTTNNKDFLRDPSGNRRFLPVDIHPEGVTRSVFNDLTPEVVDQIWAETVQAYNNKERLYLSYEVEKMALEEQRNHSEFDDRLGLVEEFLEIRLPPDWKEKAILERKLYFDDPLSSRGNYRRDEVCVAELWCECLGKDKKEMNRYKTREVNDMMKAVDGWTKAKSTKTFGPYGKQKYYYREDRE